MTDLQWEDGGWVETPAAPTPDAAPNEPLAAEREAVADFLVSEGCPEYVAARLFDSGIITDARQVRDAALTEAEGAVKTLWLGSAAVAAIRHLREGTPNE